MDWFADSIREIAVFLILVSIISNFLPEDNYRKYIKIISGVIIILIIMNPIHKIFKGEEIVSMFEDVYKKNDLVEMKKSMEGMNSEIYQKTLEEYETEIGTQLKNCLEERGFHIEDIRIRMNVEGEELYLEEVYIRVGDRYGTYDEGVGRSTSEFIKTYLWEEYEIAEDIIYVEY